MGAKLEWHPIDQAPKDGTAVIGWYGKNSSCTRRDVQIVYCLGADNHSDDTWFTHQGYHTDPPKLFAELIDGPTVEEKLAYETARITKLNETYTGYEMPLPTLAYVRDYL